MNIISFKPLGKHFHFLLSEGTCCKCATGKCSLEDRNLEELSIINFDRPQRSERNYCICLASAMINNTLSPNAPRVIIYHHKGCGHYSFNNGQHRTCIAAHILQKGGYFDLQADYIEDYGKCPPCMRNEKILEKYKLTKFDRVFKTKKYKLLLEELSENENELTFFNEIR